MQRMATVTDAFPPAPGRTTRFGKDLTEVARQLRSSISSLITSAGLDPEDQHVLHREWGIAKTLSWKIRKVIEIDDPFLSLQQLPGKEGIEILLRKSAAAGVQSEYVQATKNAVDQFDQLIKQHCGDRETFDMMGSELTLVGRQQRDEQHRKQLFQGASYVWGVQARVHLVVRAIAPNAEAGFGDLATVGGFFDFRRLRENVEWEMSVRGQTVRSNGSPVPTYDLEPLDPASAGQVVPLMPDFCSKPPPQLNIFHEGNIAFVKLAPGEVGNNGVITYVAGAIDRKIPLVRTDDDPVAGIYVRLNTPSEMLIHDIYIHKSFTHAIPPQPRLMSMLGSRYTNIAKHKEYLPFFEPLIDIGSPSPARITPEVPRYGEILSTLFTRTGWSPSEFQGFRIKMAYPPIPTAIGIEYTLPQPT